MTTQMAIPHAREQIATIPLGDGGYAATPGTAVAMLPTSPAGPSDIDGFGCGNHYQRKYPEMTFRGDEHAVRTAFMASYHALGKREARFLRQLACIPPEFKTDDGYVTRDVAAAASDLSSDDVRAVTGELQALSLVRRRERSEYALYDEYSAILLELAGANSPEEQDAVANRLEAWQEKRKREERVMESYPALQQRLNLPDGHPARAAAIARQLAVSPQPGEDDEAR